MKYPSFDQPMIYSVSRGCRNPLARIIIWPISASHCLHSGLFDAVLKWQKVPRPKYFKLPYLILLSASWMDAFSFSNNGRPATLSLKYRVIRKSRTFSSTYIDNSEIRACVWYNLFFTAIRPDMYFSPLLRIPKARSESYSL
jgi:hypothetical protein